MCRDGLSVPGQETLLLPTTSQCVPASACVALCCPHVVCTAPLLLCPHPAASVHFPVTFVSRGELTGLFSCLHAPYLCPQTRSPPVATAGASPLAAATGTDSASRKTLGVLPSHQHSLQDTVRCATYWSAIMQVGATLVARPTRAAVVSSMSRWQAPHARTVRHHLLLCAVCS